ncbi:unnamed protein product [Linum tenue]|uniref:ABC transmembrane type-1 domain-containing protein n=1 Tax=Linum tenue TaxID=586396 RepID=A0AAV0N675_9ROSI|nr:unnamed protein product [Linum tenue]
MGKKQHLDWTAKSISSTGSERVSLLSKQGKRKASAEDHSDDAPASDLEHGAGEAANVGFGRVLSLAKPDAGKLVIGTIALLISSTSSLLIPKFGGIIIDVVSRDVTTPEQQAEALDAVKNTILEIFLIVVIGYVTALFSTFLV